jgi:hypothetical protein
MNVAILATSNNYGTVESEEKLNIELPNGNPMCAEWKAPVSEIKILDTSTHPRKIKDLKDVKRCRE